jgi:tetratricopeptide (TPR) repeat protein
MEALTILRRLAEQHSYPALREACLETGAADPAVQVLLTLADIHLGNLSAGQRRLACLDRDALPVDARVDLAVVHIALGEIDQAIKVLELCRREQTDHPLLLARLAWCRLQQGQRDEALALYERSLSLRPILAVYFNLLRLYRDSGRLADMAACLDAAWTFWQQDQAAWPEDRRRMHSRQLRGLQLDLWLAQARIEAAEAWIEREQDALDEDDWCDLLADFARRLAAGDRHAQAEEWLRIGLRRYPEHLALYVRLAELVQLQGRTLQAIALLRRAIALASAHGKPTDPLWTRLSTAALQFHPALARQAADQARDELDKLGEPTARDAMAMVERRLQVDLALAAVEAQERDYAAAEQGYRRVLERRPQMIAALQGLGQLCMQLGRIDEAVALFERVKAIDPTRGHGALINARRFPQDADTL